MPRELSVGMTGDDVRVLQKLLNLHLGGTREKLVADGIFGRKTKARVIEFQTLNRLYPVRMPFTKDVQSDARKPLKADGIVGQHTMLVLLDTRELNTDYNTKFAPKVQEQAGTQQRAGAGSSLGVVRPGFATPKSGIAPVSDPSPPSPSRTYRLIQLSAGQQATVNPWSLSPFVLTGQIVLLAKNDGRPDFLLTAAGQASLNDGKANGRWTGQGSLQMGLGGFPKLFGKLDLLNPFTALMLSKNSGQPWTFGLAGGNQATWTLASRPLPGTKDDFQDTISIFFNAQAVVNIDLSNGRASAPGGQFLFGSIFTFF